MRIKLWLFGLVAASSVFLHTSSCRYVPQLLSLAEQGVQSELNYLAAAQAQSELATERLLALAIETKQAHWLEQLTKLNQPEAFYHLALLTESGAERNRYLHTSAKLGHMPALFELGITEANAKVKERYLTEAAQQGDRDAQYALYQWYWFNHQYQQGLPWLKRVAETDEEAAMVLALHLWRQGKHDASTQWLIKAQRLGHPQALDYQRLIRQYWRKPPKKVVQHAEQCAMTLQFVATSLDSLKQAESYLNRFKSDKRLRSLPICVNAPLWIEQKSFQCQSRASNNYRISCPLERLEPLLQPEHFSHLVVFTEQGKANVVNGVMYLDLADKYSVFVHELAHFVGFVDEYPLSAGFAEYFCQGQNYYPNLFVLQEDETLEDVELSQWQALGSNMAVSRANTCNNHTAQAYKLSSKLTFMEFHDTGFIPPLYLEVWKQRLNDRNNLRIAAINIAQALEERGNSPAAQKWWLYYDKWRAETPATP